MVAVDVHAHWVPPAYLDWMRREGSSFGRSLVTLADGQLAVRADEREIPLPASFFEPEERLTEMRSQRVDCQVVSPPPFMFHYDLPPALGEALCRLYNDEALALSRQFQGRFLPMGVLPLQEPESGVDELQRIAALGFRAVEIGASINERELDDPALHPFWDAAERLGTLVFVHPVRPPGRERMNDYHLFNLIGFLAESTLACARLIFSGTMQRHPGLRVCLAHAGGMIPWVSGRFDHGYATLAVCRRNIDSAPSAYLSQFYCDSIAHGAEQLAFLCRAVGAKRVLMGSDFPFRIGDLDPVGHVEAAGLRAPERSAIIGGNAAELFDFAATEPERQSPTLHGRRVT